jgi:hypothetical protein
MHHNKNLIEQPRMPQIISDQGEGPTVYELANMRLRICGPSLPIVKLTPIVLIALVPTTCFGRGIDPRSVSHHIIQHTDELLPGALCYEGESPITGIKAPTDATIRNESTINQAQISFYDLVKEAEKHAENDQILAAARKLRLALGDSSRNNHRSILSLTASHRKLLDVADRIEETIIDLASVPDPKVWTKHEETHDGKRDILVHYKLDEKRRLTSRIEFLIQKQLLIPLLAVLVETELYTSWVPRWRFPPVGVNNVKKLAQQGRTKQIIHADLEIPWRRDVVISSIGVEDVDQKGILGIHLGAMRIGEELEGCAGQKIPPPEQGVVRVDFEGCFIFQKCPPNHPVLKQYHSRQRRDKTLNDPEELILVGFTMFANANISSLFPQWIVNFIIRVAIVRVFRIFIAVAEDIQAGKRPDHTAAISRRRAEIYDWIDERVAKLLSRPDNESPN